MKRRNRRLLRNILLSLLIFIPILIGCSQPSNGEIPEICTYGKSPCLQGKAIVEMTTNRGKITLELNGEASPMTAGNFVDLINRGFYEKTTFHRVIRKPEPFVIQGGDPLSKDTNNIRRNLGTGMFIDPISGQPRVIPLEIKLKNEAFPRYGRLINNPIELNQLQLIHKRGSISMARSKDLDSASAQFYIALKSLPELDGRYSVFGEVIEGMEIVDEIIQGDLIIKTSLLRSE